jgi:uroporphyrinogen-III synthase
MKNILITRPQNQAQDLLEVLQKAGFKVFVEPLFLVKKIEIKKDFFAAKNSQISALILTSANACDAVIDCGFSKDIKIFVVGKKTAQKLQAEGFKNIKIAPQNSAISLRDLIIKTERNKLGSILYFQGSIVSLDFKTELEKNGFTVEKVLCYQTYETENFSSDLLSFVSQNSFNQVALFSQNSAKTFFKLARKHNLLEYFKGSQILCLSEKILAAVKSFGFPNSVTFNEFSILKKFYD